MPQGCGRPRWQTLAPFWVCAVRDPDGNVIEFSWNQKVFEKIRELWGDQAAETAV
jgi:hypothetical protein